MGGTVALANNREAPYSSPVSICLLRPWDHWETTYLDGPEIVCELVCTLLLVCVLTPPKTPRPPPVAPFQFMPTSRALLIIFGAKFSATKLLTTRLSRAL